MGACFSKPSENETDPAVVHQNVTPTVQTGNSIRRRLSSALVLRQPRRTSSTNADEPKPGTSTHDIVSTRETDPRLRIPLSRRTVDWLVLQAQLHIRATLLLGASTVDPVALVMLSVVAETEEGFLLVIESLVNSFPILAVKGVLIPDVIPVILDGCDLPTNVNWLSISQVIVYTDGQNVKSIATRFGKSLDLTHASKYDTLQRKNICRILIHMADSMGGQNTALLTAEVMEFLLAQFDTTNKPVVMLNALLTLEKLAGTSENKARITRALNQLLPHPLIRLEKWKRASLRIKRLVGFCAQWALDNVFLVPGRPFGYERVKNNSVNVILNNRDTSPYLKVSADGFEARCDVGTFESVRSTFPAETGSWYYEVHILTNGQMQIGWATKSTKFLNQEQSGVGDDRYSVAYDGSRQQIWFDKKIQEVEMQHWRYGDVMGSYLDLESLEVTFYLNGQLVATHTGVFENARTGFYAAASLTGSQQCVFNFGHRPFKYPPKDKKFNIFGEKIEPGQNLVALPKHIILQEDAKKLRRMSSVKENVCTICCDKPVSIQLSPCDHSGFCSSCADQLENCPVCRQEIQSKVIMMQ